MMLLALGIFIILDFIVSYKIDGLKPSKFHLTLATLAVIIGIIDLVIK